MNKNKTINNFTDLDAWKINHQIAIKIYNATKNFPREELFGITSQTRRAISSTTANIAEGFGRFRPNDRIHFYHQARGSLTETENHIILAKDLGYLHITIYNEIIELINSGKKLINGLIRSTRNLPPY